MDYRHYRGNTRNAPRWLTKKLYLLQYVGGVLMISSPLIGLLSVLNIFTSSLLLACLGYLNMFLGITCYIIGFYYDNSIDRSD